MLQFLSQKTTSNYFKTRSYYESQLLMLHLIHFGSTTQSISGFEVVRNTATCVGGTWSFDKGDRTTLTPGPWTTLRTWSTDHCTDLSKDPPTDPSLRTPHKKTTIKMTIRDLTYHLFSFFFFLLMRWKEDLHTSKKTNNSAIKTCVFAAGLRLHPSFCSSHSSSCSVTRPRLLRKRPIA